MKFTVEKSCGGFWYIVVNEDYKGYWRYLLPDNTIGTPEQAIEYNWKTEREAKTFLQNYLKGKGMNFDERLIQCNKDIAALQAEKEKILKEKKAAEEKKFYIGDKFTTGNITYMLVKECDTDKARLITIDSPNKCDVGRQYKCGTTVPVFYDYTNCRSYTKQLPTCYPGDFGLDRKYGV